VIGPRARTPVAVVVLLALFAARADSAAAEEKLRVLIVIDASDDPFAERIRAEVSALGLEVVAVEPWRTGEAIESLDAAGRANQAAAAIRMVASRKGVEIWVANQPTGRSLLRQLIVDERAPAPNEGLVALQTAELLRTTLLSRSETAPPPPRPVPTIKEEPPPAPPSPPNAGAQAGFGVLWSPRGGSEAYQMWATIHRFIVRPLGIALDFSAPVLPWAPVSPGTVSGPEGSATVDALLAGAAVFLRYERPTSGLYATAAAGVAVIRLAIKGSAGPAFRDSSHTVTVAAGYVRADAGFQVNSWLRFGGRAVAGVVPSGVTVQFAGNEAAVWGQPFLAGLVLADVSW
jgi:hypothetical protein